MISPAPLAMRRFAPLDKDKNNPARKNGQDCCSLRNNIYNNEENLSDPDRFSYARASQGTMSLERILKAEP
jgi:hypothetical protein